MFVCVCSVIKIRSMTYFWFSKTYSSITFELASLLMPRQRETLQQIKERTAREIKERTEARIARLRLEAKDQDWEEEQVETRKKIVVTHTLDSFLCVLLSLLIVLLLLWTCWL